MGFVLGSLALIALFAAVVWVMERWVWKDAPEEDDEDYGWPW